MSRLHQLVTAWSDSINQFWSSDCILDKNHDSPESTYGVRSSTYITTPPARAWFPTGKSAGGVVRSLIGWGCPPAAGMAAGRGPNGTSAGSISAPLRPFGRGNLGSGIARTAGNGNGYCAIHDSVVVCNISPCASRFDFSYLLELSSRSSPGIKIRI